MSHTTAGRLITVAEAAERLDTPVRFVRRLIAERRIPFHKIGRHVRIHTHDIDDFIAAGRVEPVVIRRRPR
jgi:excisionase family DNA binding protein